MFPCLLSFVKETEKKAKNVVFNTMQVRLVTNNELKIRHL